MKTSPPSNGDTPIGVLLHPPTVLTGTSGGTADNSGIFLADGQEQIQVARTGQVLAGSTIAGIFFAGGGSDQGGDSTLNDFGQVAYRADLANGTSGVFLFTPEIHYRPPFSGAWDTNANWTMSLSPGNPHAVFIDPAASLTVFGPTTNRTVDSLQIGGGTGLATLRLQSGAGGLLCGTEYDAFNVGQDLTIDGMLNPLVPEPSTDPKYPAGRYPDRRATTGKRLHVDIPQGMAIMAPVLAQSR